jgi:heat-inducible transcriptional repressor
MKKEIILNHLIDLYLKENTPVSSGVLKEKCELPFSSSTIRNYFQKLDSEGLLLKVHISSGSIPSKEALRRYWYENLNYDKIELKNNSLKDLASEFDLFLALRKKEFITLKSVINFQNRFIILDFEKYEIVFRYSSEVFHFFTQFLNYSIDDLRKIVLQLKLDNFYKKLNVGECKNFNKEFLYKHYKDFSIDKLITDEVFNQFKKGLSFRGDFIAYKIDSIFDKKESEMIVIGSLYNDYKKFFKALSA